MTQPEALRLADLLEQIDGKHWRVQDSAAAELRRLSAVEADVERKSNAIQRLWRERDKLRTANAALLEALRAMRVKYGQYPCRVCDLADAAIKQAEGETNGQA